MDSIRSHLKTCSLALFSEPILCFDPLTEGAGRRAHLIGAAGSGMRCLARLLATAGWRLSGCDASAPGEFPTHARSHITPDLDLVIHSVAIPASHSERQRAAELSIPQLSYPQVAGWMMRGRQGIAVAGTHGKSTTTAMTAEILAASGLLPSVLVGADVAGRRPDWWNGSGGHLLLAEACEYRGSFFQLTPTLATVLCVEPDHFDCFETETQLFATFAAWVDRLPPQGCLVVAADCHHARQLFPRPACRRVTFGSSPTADWRATSLDCQPPGCSFTIQRQGQVVARVRLRVPGRHNVQNALAAAALASEAGAQPTAIVAGLERYSGLRRRLQDRGLWCGIPWTDDYAHHPTAIAAGLATLRVHTAPRQLWCVLQPHQNSRLARLLPEFAAALQAADRVAVAPVDTAREAPTAAPLCQAAALIAELRRRGCRTLAGTTWTVIRDELQSAIGQGELTAQDRIVTMGAGDVDSNFAPPHWTPVARLQESSTI